MKREGWAALGLVLVIVGLLVLSFSNAAVAVDNYTSKASVENPNNSGPELSVSHYFESGNTFFFNFSKGTFWGVKYDVENGMNPTYVTSNVSIPPYKEVYFDLYTPSGDTISTYFLVAGGYIPYLVGYYNQSADFTIAEDGNLTMAHAGLEGTINRNGNYTVKAVEIDPPVYKDQNTMYDIAGDPPQQMSLWTVQTVETKPYFVLCVSGGTILIFSGLASEIWTGTSKMRVNRRLKRKRKR